MNQLKKFQKKYGFTIAEEYKTFLESAPGDSRLASELVDAAQIWSKPKAGEVESTSFYDDIARLHLQEGFIEDIANGEEEGGEMHFWHPAFLRHAYPIGSSGGGDPIVQIASGTHKGEIYFVNHESWYGGAEALASGNEEELEEFMEDIEDVLEELELESLEDLDTDTWIRLFSNENLDFMFLMAKNFQEFYIQLTRSNEEESDEEEESD